MIKECPKCNLEMVEGLVIDRGDYSIKLQPVWVEGEPEESFWSGLKTSGKEAFTVQAFRCRVCNYLEFYTTDQVNI